MRLASKTGLAAGVLIGALAAALTFTIGRLMSIAPNLALRWLETAAFTLIVPGATLQLVAARNSHSLPAWVAATSNFVFWLGFAWLFGFLLGELRRQLRLFASRP
ncbi:MAG TPA: hypothetical protein VG267_05480 [Terracidiphilus sp.]|nr:hypothetical protein [Terracidiphilus sp.]